MGEIVLVGLGLHDEMGISLRGLQEVKTADNVFLELYTSLLPAFSKERFEEVSGKRLVTVCRKELEDNNGDIILESSKIGKTILLVPGDPLIATTHVALRIEAEKRKITTRIVHGASAISATIGLSGLHNYKFGKSVTIPFPENSSETPYDVITENKERGLHTLCLLDLQAEENRYLKIPEALEVLLKMEKKKKKGVVTVDTLAVGIARAGSDKPVVKADFVQRIKGLDFGDPPCSLIFPGKLHFMEAEALIVLAGGPEELRKMTE